MVKIQRVTLAATQVAAMVAFYNAVLDANLSELDGMPSFYQGNLGQLNLLVCPNTVAEVVAEQNRQQFLVEVTDIEDVVNAATQHGGTLMDDGITRDEHAARAALYDPDGNSLELIQVLS
ncbi:MAG: VOC family protein [Deinococcota bacterium]